MGGILDFLTQGTAPPNVSTSGSTTTSLPSWLNDYALNTISQANQIAAQPYTPYSGPRVAGFTTPQTQAFNLAQSNVGNWQPALNQASGLANSVGSNSFTNPNTINSYMNPYTTDVINQGTNLAMQNYNQNIKPALDNQFTSAGQYGSSAHERAANQNTSQLTQNLQQQDQAALAQAYNTAGTMFNQDQSTKLGAAGQLSGLAQAYQGLGTGDVANLSNIGAQQQQQNQGNLNLAYQDFQNQLNYPKSQLGWLQQTMSGIPHGQTTSTAGSAPLPGAQYGASQAGQLASGASTLTGLYKALAGGNGGSNGFDYSTIDSQLNSPGLDLSNPGLSYTPQDYNFSDYSGGLNNLSLANMKRGGLATVFRGPHGR